MPVIRTNDMIIVKTNTSLRTTKGQQDGKVNHTLGHEKTHAQLTITACATSSSV